MATRHVVVDGSNLATEGRSTPSLQQLDEAVRAFLKEHPDDVITVVVDATFEHRIDASERHLYEEASDAAELVSPPAGTIGRGDKFLLEIAQRADAIVLSNDSFQEFHGEYEWLFDTGRLVGGKPVPGIGWIFTDRTPVRGPRSRRAVREAGDVSPAKKSSPRRTAAKKAPAKKAPARGGPAIGATKRAPRPTAAARVAPPASAEAATAATRRRRGRRPEEPVNEPLPFIEFIAEHPVGTTVKGEVEEFSSHGAYVRVNAARCYVPLKGMGRPAPRSARTVLAKGEVRTFVVQSLNPARRGIDLALPGFADIEPGATGAGPDLVGQVDEVPLGSEQTVANKATTARAPARKRAASNAAVNAATADRAPAEAGAEPIGRERTTNRPSAKKTAARKTSAKKTSARKAPARKTTARKAPARKTAAKKATTRKSTARKAPARKTTAKKAPARKSTAKKAPARKSTAKKSTARKSTARKSTARKSTARKSTARKSTAKKTTTRKAPARKAPARKTTAKKSTARKTTARKAPARKSTAKRTTAKKTGTSRASARRS